MERFINLFVHDYLGMKSNDASINKSQVNQGNILDDELRTVKKINFPDVPIRQFEKSAYHLINSLI